MKRRQMLCALASAAGLGFLPRAALARSSIAFGELYSGSSVLGLTFSEKLKSLEGKKVSIQGFMAPPLKADAAFLVLTSEPVSLGPFCNSDQDWPDNIIVVWLENRQDFVQANRLIEVTGTLELGSKTDEETGFVSLVRLVDARFEVR